MSVRFLFSADTRNFEYKYTHFREKRCQVKVSVLIKFSADTRKL